MALTPEEKQAVELDILRGIRSIYEYIAGVNRAMPVAVNQLDPHDANTRKLLTAHGKLVEAQQQLIGILRNNTVKVKGETK